MAGLKLVLPTLFTDPSLPVLRDDPILSSGSLILLDYTHPARPMSSGVPASGTLVPNIASDTAIALAGGAVTDVDLPFVYGSGLTGAKGKLERTGRGGVHGIVSQAVDLADGDGAAFQLPVNIEAYIVANPTHRYYLSVWDRVTRPAATTSTIMEAGIVGPNNTQYLGAFAPGGVQQPTVPVPSTNYRAIPGFNSPGNRFASMATTTDSTLNASVSYQGGHIFGAFQDSYNGVSTAARNRLWPSLVAYRFYVEDLTVSGRSYAQVGELDYAEYTKHVLTPGGRYYGDTFTDPTTIP